jgi:polyhydroxyalkanoate synthesis regulator phasin
MPNTTNTQLTIVDELKNQLGGIKDKIKQSGVTSAIFETLTTNAKLIQTQIDTLLGKGGLYTQSDVNDAYATLQEVKRRELELEEKKAKNKAFLYLGVAVAISIGIYLYVKKK